jgi:hypothetical protein
MRGILASLIYDDYISQCDIMSRLLSGDRKKAGSLTTPAAPRPIL